MCKDKYDEWREGDNKSMTVVPKEMKYARLEISERTVDFTLKMTAQPEKHSTLVYCIGANSFPRVATPGVECLVIEPDTYLKITAENMREFWIAFYCVSNSTCTVNVVLSEAPAKEISGLSTGAIAGIVIGSLAFVSCVVGAIFYFTRH
jgi:hypothetical protein